MNKILAVLLFVLAISFAALSVRADDGDDTTGPLKGPCVAATSTQGPVTGSCSGGCGFWTGCVIPCAGLTWNPGRCAGETGNCSTYASTKNSYICTKCPCYENICTPGSNYGTGQIIVTDCTG